MDFSWIDSHSSKFAQALGGKVSIGVSCNTESINRTSWMEDGMIITLVISGSGKVVCQGESSTIGPSMVLFRHPGVEYALSLTGSYFHRRCYLMLPREVYSMMCLVHPEVMKAPIVFPVDDIRRHLDDFLLVYEHIEKAEDEDFFSLLPVLERYILKLLAPYSSEGRVSSLRQAKSMLEDDFKSSLDEIADKCLMSYNTFRKNFARAYGVSPQQYRLRSRIEKAKQLLSMGYQCTEVASMLGYPDLFTFSHQFKLMVGQSPKDYRMEHIL